MRSRRTHSLKASTGPTFTWSPDLFVPQLTDPTDTGYFDRRGNDEAHFLSGGNSESGEIELERNGDCRVPNTLDLQHLIPRTEGGHFVNFSYKSLPSLANLNRLHHEALSLITSCTPGGGISQLDNSSTCSFAKISDSDASEEQEITSTSD